jgi:uncharacterized protein (TIGR02058 family)
MTRKRFVVELGFGADLHGGSQTKAACRAVQDAISRSCLCGLFDIVGITDPMEMHVAIMIGCPQPESVDGDLVLATIPFGTKELEVVTGGLTTRGLELSTLGCGDSIVMAVAALTVSVEVPEFHRE